jgi:hypothetical protein
MPAIDGLFVRSKRRQADSQYFEGGMDLFANHQFSFATGASAAAHQLHHSQRNSNAKTSKN